MPVGLLVSVFLLMFLFLKHLAVHTPCQDYFEELAIVSMSARDPLMLREFMTVISLLYTARGMERGERAGGCQAWPLVGFTPVVPTCKL